LVERNGELVVGNYCPVVREDLYYESLKETIIKRSILVFPLVAWEAFAKAFNKLSRPHQISYVKLSHCLVQTNSQNHRYYGTSALCTGCKLHEELLKHVWSCPSSDIAQERKALVEIYKATLEDFVTPPRLIDTLLHGVKSWILVQQGNLRRQIAPTEVEIQYSAVTAAYTEQTTRISREAFLRGRVGLAWGTAYRAFFPDANEGEILNWLSDLIRANRPFNVDLATQEYSSAWSRQDWIHLLSLGPRALFSKVGRYISVFNKTGMPWYAGSQILHLPSGDKQIYQRGQCRRLDSFFFHGLGEGMRTHQSLPRKQTGPLPAHMAAYWELIPAGGTDQWVVFQMKN
jgi:hypothetical protein